MTHLIRKIIKIRKIAVFWLMLFLQLIYVYLPFLAIGGANFPVKKVAAVNNTGMVVYSTGTNAAPRYRTWDGTAFSAEGTAATVTGTIEWLTNKEAPTRSENIVGTIASTGNISFQVYSNSSWGNVISVGTIGTTYDNYLGFDIAYEEISGKGMVIYEKDATSDKNIYYQIWNGSSWGGEQTLTYSSGSNGQIAWVRAETKPFSNEIMLVTEDANSDIRAIVWNGSSWVNEQMLTTAASVLTTRPFDVAYEYGSGDALVAYGTSTTLNFWTYSGGSWTDGTGGANCSGTGTTNTCATVSGAVVNLDLSASNENNYIAMSTIESTGSDYSAQMWDGTQWLAMPQAQGTWDEAGAVEWLANENPQAITYDDVNNRFMFMYVLNGLLLGQYYFYDLDTGLWYNGDGTTQITDIDSVTTTTPASTTLDDMSWFSLLANPLDGSQIMLTADDILNTSNSRFWDGSAWSAPTNSNHGDGGTTLAKMASFTWDRTVNITSVGTSGTQVSTLPIGGTNKYIGGAFTLINNAVSANITSITLSEKEATFNANTNASNLILWYKQENTCSSSIPADATRFNSTPGTFNASDKSTVTGTMAVGTSQVCVYATLNVGSGASAGQKIEIEISTPSTEVISAANAIVPATAVSISGTTTLEAAKMIVDTSGTQRVEMGIPSESSWIGGAFTFLRNATSTNVTSIKLKETNTVNAYNHINNVIVWYKQEDTCSTDVFPADATQFNSTPGTFNASDEVTVTGNMAIGTSQVCVYVKINILDTANEGDLFDLQITNPSTDVLVTSESVSPATVVAISGYTAFHLPTYVSYGAPFVYTQANWGSGGTGVEFFYELYWKKILGNVFGRVYDETSGTEVTGSRISITSANFIRSRSGALTLTDGHTYRAQLGHVSGASGEALSARLIVGEHSAGVDLAEYYSSSEALDLGEVVAIDSAKSASVKKSNSAYQGDVLGIVSSQPGIILGDNIGQSYPIALVGRVPVKVTTENGAIKAGDFITSSSTPGYAMRASKAGRVLGQSLEALEIGQFQNCPSGISDEFKCGTVLVFVNLFDYKGISVEVMMSENQPLVFDNSASNTDLNTSGLTITDNQNSIIQFVNGENFSADENLAKLNKILTYLSQLKTKQASSSAGQSEIFADRVSAVNEIISPSIMTELLVAKKIKADSIEGLEIYTNQIGSLNDKYNQLAGQIAGESTMSAEVSDSANINPTPTNLLAAIFDFNGQSIFKGNLLIKALTEFWDKVMFKGQTEFEKVPVFNKETAGFAVINVGETAIEVKFSEAMMDKPVVNITLLVTDDSPDLGENYSYYVTKQDRDGFVIRLNKIAKQEMRFAWSALVIRDPKTFQNPTVTILPSPTVVSLPTPSMVEMPSVTLIPTAIVIPTSIESPTLIPTPTLAPSLVPTLTPTLSPELTNNPVTN